MASEQRRSGIESSYAMFVGAGASAALARYLRLAAAELSKENKILPTSSEFLDALNVELPQTEPPKVVELWRSLNGRKPRNIEELIRELDALQQGLKIAQGTIPGCAECEGVDAALGACTALRRVLHSKIFAHYRLSHGIDLDEHIAGFYAPLLDSFDTLFAKESTKNLVIVTTNIDLAFERLCGSSYGQNRFIRLLDGFRSLHYPANAVWENDFHVSPSDRARKLGMLTLIKLHGSLNWYYVENSNQVGRLPINLPSSVKPSPRDSAFLYPAYEKDVVGRKIYSDLSIRLVEAIGSVKNWVFSGFSFKDAWINHELNLAFGQAPPRNLLVIDPCLSEEDLPENMREAAQIINRSLEDLRDDFGPAGDAVRTPREQVKEVRKAAVSATASIGLKIKRPHLVAYWRLTEESVDVENRLALDIGPRSMDGVIVGATFRECQALFFDGVKTFIDIGAHENMISGQEMTVVARARSFETFHDQVILASQGETNADFLFGISPERKLFLELTADGVLFDLALSSTSLDTQDHCVAVTAKWSTETSYLAVDFYIDGERCGQRKPWAGATITPLRKRQKRLPMYVSIGASMPAVDLYHGYLSDVQLYERALEPAKIKSLCGVS
jgi:hypothetical protein